MNLHVPVHDAQRIEVVCNGLPLWHGSQVASGARVRAPAPPKLRQARQCWQDVGQMLLHFWKCRFVQLSCMQQFRGWEPMQASKMRTLCCREMRVCLHTWVSVFFFLGPFCNHSARSQCTGEAKTKSRATQGGQGSPQKSKAGKASLDARAANRLAAASCARGGGWAEAHRRGDLRAGAR